MDLPGRLLERLLARPLLLAPVLGALAACGFEPLHLWPLTLLAVAGLIELTARATSRRRAFLIGWLWGVGHFTIGNNWIATAFTYQAQMPAWMGWIAVFLTSLYLAVFPALAVLGSWHLRRNYAALALGFMGFWIITEWMRSWVFTGFVWNPLGVAALGPANRTGLAGLAREVGTYGLSGLVVLFAASILIALKRARADLRGIGMVVLPLLAFFDPFPAGKSVSGTVPFTLVQANTPQDRLNDPANFETQFVRSAQMSTPTPDEARGRLLLWSESGVPDLLREGYPAAYYDQTTFGADPKLARERLGRVAGGGSLLLTGAVDLEVRGAEVVGARNAVTALDGSGAIRGSYYKAHLVPGGEYLPLRWLLEPIGLSRLVPGDIDFWAGPGPRTLDLGRFGKAGVQICYEIVFSGEVVDRSNRPDYIFNPTNDGWFGAWGPPQHLAQARLRAIEEGLPVLRVTTNGISAVIDADGRVVRSLGRNVYGRIDGLIPPAAPPTLFARAGNRLPLGLAVVLLAFAALVLRRARG